MTDVSYLVLDSNGNALNLIVIDDQMPVPDFLTANGQTLIPDFTGDWEPGKAPV